MAHRAGTGDAPIPGLVTSRRNPAYRLKPRAKAQDGIGRHDGKPEPVAAAPQHRRRSASRGRRKSPARDPEAERLSREKREEEERVRREQEEKEQAQKRAEEEESQKRRWAVQEAKWAEERSNREAQRKVEEQRQVQRQQKLKGAFATNLDDEDEEETERARELADRQRRRAAVAASSAPTLLSPVSSGSAAAAAAASTSASTALALPGSASSRPQLDEDGDPVRLRAALADPSAARSFAPGEVAEHFRRLSEMKRRFRRAEFGGPDRKRDPSRSRSRDKYNSVWIRPGSKPER